MNKQCNYDSYTVWFAIDLDESSGSGVNCENCLNCVNCVNCSNNIVRVLMLRIFNIHRPKNERNEG